MCVNIQNNLPGTQSIFIPKPDTAQEWIISSKHDISLTATRVSKTNTPVILNSLP